MKISTPEAKRIYAGYLRETNPEGLALLIAVGKKFGAVDIEIPEDAALRKLLVRKLRK